MKNVEDSHRALRFLEEIEISKEEGLTQRDLSKKMGVALGLTNSYLRNLVSKGYVKVAAIPPKRYKYYLTPKGFLEKSRLTYELLHNYTRVFKEARRDYSRLFQEMKASGVRSVFFAGVDEVAEIAYISLQEVGLTFLGAADEKAGGEFFRIAVLPFEHPSIVMGEAPIVVTTYRKRDEVLERLLNAGVDKGRVNVIYPAR